MTGAHDLGATFDQLPLGELEAVLGAALVDSGSGVGPNDPSRLGRFARAWFAAQKNELWSQVRATTTYAVWVQSAGPGQVAETGVLVDALAGQEGDDRLEAALAALLFRDQLDRDRRGYDIAVSAAQDEAVLVTAVVRAAQDRGLRVFHAAEMTNEWWGRNFLAEGRRIYGQLAWHFVPFLSAAYLTKPQLRDAFATAMVAALARADGYILPVLVGTVRVPAEMLPPYVGVLRAKDHSPEQLADALRDKVAQTKGQHQAARDFGAAVRAAADAPDS